MQEGKIGKREETVLVARPREALYSSASTAAGSSSNRSIKPRRRSTVFDGSEGCPADSALSVRRR